MRIVVISDTHISASAAPDCRRKWVNWMLTGKAADISRALVKEINELHPHLVLHAGDITDSGDDDSFRMAAEIFEKCEVPFRFTVGAHDTYNPGARERLASAFGYRDFSAASAAFDLRNWRVVLLDSSWWLKRDGSVHASLDRDEYGKGEYLGLVVPRQEVERLSRELRANSGTDIILVTHHRMARKSQSNYANMYYPEATSMPNPTPYDTCFKNSEDILHILGNHENVRMIFSGDAHMNELIQRDGKLFCTVAGACVYPMEYRVIDISEQHVSVATR
ncbi:metallophosphoesterase family protein, partial [Verrucomicrobiota bacterium]